MPHETFYEAVRRHGVARRDFLRFCATTTALLGLESTVYTQVVKALETAKRPPIYWLNFAACTCCSESLIKSSHPLGEGASLIGRVGEGEAHAVILQSSIGAHRIVDMFTGEQLPRIC